MALTDSFDRVRDCGDRALLLECADTAEVMAWAPVLRSAGLPGLLDVVPAARTVLLMFVEPRHRAAARRSLGELRVDAGAAATPDARAEVVIDVIYDGEDLDDVARLSGLTPAEVVVAHTARPQRVGFGGFAPGFAYLVGGDPRLHVPRRDEPRTRVPAGSVGLAGEFSGIYPRASPGGWQLIGRTGAALWELDRDPPALLEPGVWVRFRAVGGSP